MIKRLGLLVLGLWLVDLALGLLFRTFYSMVAAPTGAWMLIIVAVGFALGAIPSVVAAWLIGRWHGLLGHQLSITTAVAYLVGLVVGLLVVGPLVTGFLRTNPVIWGADPVVSDYGITALVGLFGAAAGVAVYWLVGLASKTLFRPRADAEA